MRTMRLIQYRGFCAIFPAEAYDPYSADPSSPCQSRPPPRKLWSWGFIVPLLRHAEVGFHAH